MNKLETLRAAIDAVDEQMLDLLGKRRELVSHVGMYKKTQGLPIVDSEREKKKLQSLQQKAKKQHINPTLIKRIWQILYKDAYTIEK